VHDHSIAQPEGPLYGSSTDLNIVGIGQMRIRCGGTLNTIANMSLNTPTYSYAYKYAAFDGLRCLAASRATAAAR
jgi:hypothetical protein